MKQVQESLILVQAKLRLQRTNQWKESLKETTKKCIDELRKMRATMLDPDMLIFSIDEDERLELNYVSNHC